MTTQPKPQPHKKLIVFPQDKGGIGKSFVATLLYDYLAEHGVKAGAGPEVLRAAIALVEDRASVAVAA